MTLTGIRRKKANSKAKKPTTTALAIKTARQGATDSMCMFFCIKKSVSDDLNSSAEIITTINKPSTKNIIDILSTCKRIKSQQHQNQL